MGEPAGRRRMALWLVVYLALYAVLQLAYQALRSWPDGHAWIDAVTVQAAAGLIGNTFPSDGVFAQGSRLMWPHGRLQMAAGCDGFDVLALYVPAVLVAPVRWRRGLVMLMAGVLLIWLLNQFRLLALYVTFRHWRDGFEPLHTVWGPLAMLAAVLGFYTCQLRSAR